MEAVDIMYLRIYSQKKLKKEIYAGQYECPGCGKYASVHLCKIKQKISMLFIPIFSNTLNRLVVCDCCGAYKKISKQDYSSLKKIQVKKLKSGNFPPQVILEDYNPDKLGYGKKIAALVIASLFAFAMIFGGIVMMMDIPVWDASVPLFFLFCLVIGIVPFVFALRSFLDARWKRRIYKSVK